MPGELAPVPEESTTPSPPLERSYRRLLRVLPNGYRERWADDMVATLVETEQQAAADSVAGEGAGRQAEEREIALLGRPPAREVAAVVLLAVRLHLAAPSTPGASEAGRRWGEAVRRLALLTLAGAAATSAVLLLSALIAPIPADVSDQVSRADLWRNAAPGGLWVVGFVYLVCGRVRAAVVCAVLACVPGVWGSVWSLVSAGAWNASSLVGRVVSLGLYLLPVLALAAWRTEAPRPDRRWLLVPPVIAAAQLLVALPVLLRPSLWAAAADGAVSWLLGDLAGTTCLSAVAGAVVALLRRDASWWRTAALLAVAGALGRLATLLGVGWAPEQLGVVVAVVGAQLVAVLVVVTAAVAALRRLHRRR